MSQRYLLVYKYLALVPIFAILLVFSTLVHELGHGFTAEILGGKFLSIDVYPGIQIWPKFGQIFTGVWDNHIALMYYQYGPGWLHQTWQKGLVLMMGSGTNLLLASFALILLWVFQPGGLLRIILLAESLMFLDVVFYTFLPLVGLRHLFFIGGGNPEPLEGAILMGVPQPIFLLGMAVILALYSTLFVRLIKPRSI